MFGSGMFSPILRAAPKKQRRPSTCSPGERRTPSSPPLPPWPARATWPSRWTSSPRACSGIPAAAAILVACRVAASWTAFALAGTAKPDAAGGWEIPALYSAASDQPVPVTQDCTSSSGFQVCVHPAFSFYLDDLAAAFDPVAAEIAGLPGAPVGAKEVASMSGGQDVQSGISVNPPVFEFTAEHVGTMFGEFYGIPDAAGWGEGFQQGLLDAFLTGRPPHAGPVPILLGPAQQAVEDALLTAVGSQPLSAGVTSAGASAAAQRFATLSASARRAWLAAHLAALRAGKITPAQIP